MGRHPLPLPLVPSAALALLALASVAPALAAGTHAGTAVTNRAQVTYTMSGVAGSAQSNTINTTVLQVFNVVATVQTPSVAVTAGDQNRALTFRITNTGNGPDSFVLSAQSGLPGDTFTPVLATPTSIYLDADNNGVLSAGDTPYVPGTSIPLAADASITLFVLNSIPAGLPSGDSGRSQISAVRTAGAGTPGQVLSGGGVGGIDAIFGTSGDQAQQAGKYVVGSAAGLSAVKSQTVVDPRGGARPISGASITYAIAVTPSGNGTIAAAQFTDAVPTGTTYKPGSLTLNGTTLTDASGDDAGQYQTTPVPEITVALGNLSQASGVQTITFAVTIN